MRIIALDAARWQTALEFYEDLLSALDAPFWHGRNLNALYDSIVWGDINGVEPPYTVHIRNLSRAGEDAKEELDVFFTHLPEQEAERVKLQGEPSGVVFEVER
jgi:RNAse (barnase) inhibitor barstar